MLPQDRKRGLTANELRERLRYEPETGQFFQRKRTNQWPIDQEVGSISPNGYRRIRIDNKKYMAHRLAWLYVLGEWPSKWLDHKDGNRANNIWSNLREATASQNMVNAKTRKTNKLGIKGVRLHENGRYQARVGIGNSRYKHLGLFDTLEEAREAYRVAVIERNGDFARLE